MVYTYERANEDALRLVARFLLQGRIGVGESAPAHKYERLDIIHPVSVVRNLYPNGISSQV